MDEKTKSVALRLLKIKDELFTIMYWSFDNDYVTFSDQYRLIEAVGRLNNLEFLEDMVNLNENC